MGKRVLLLFFVAALSVAAHASRVTVDEPPCNPSDFQPQYVLGPSALQKGFNPIGPIQGGGTFTFCNDTGQQLNSILFAIETSVPASQIDCPSGNATSNPNDLAFFACLVTPAPNHPGLVYALFAFTTTAVSPPFALYPGVPNLYSFTVDFNCTTQDNDGTCLNLTPQTWPTDTQVFGYVSTQQTYPGPFPVPPVPEPASFLLLASGLGAWIRFKR